MGKDTRDLYKVVTSASKDNQFQDVNNTEQKSSQSRLAELMIAYSEQYASIRPVSDLPGWSEGLDPLLLFLTPLLLASDRPPGGRFDPLKFITYM